MTPNTGTLALPKAEAQPHLLNVLQGPTVLGFCLLNLQQAAAPLVIFGHAHFLWGQGTWAKILAAFTPIWASAL